MADTMIFALIGSLIVTLTLLPVLCSWLMRSGVRERRNAIFERIRSSYTRGLDRCLARPRGNDRRLGAASARLVAAVRRRRRRVHAASRRGRAVGARDHAVHDLVR